MTSERLPGRVPLLVAAHREMPRLVRLQSTEKGVESQVSWKVRSYKLDHKILGTAYSGDVTVELIHDAIYENEDAHENDTCTMASCPNRVGSGELILRICGRARLRLSAANGDACLGRVFDIHGFGP